MTAEALVELQVDASLKAAFLEAAKTSDRTASQLLNDFMQDFIQQQKRRDYDSWLADKVNAARTAADQGRLSTEAEVEARLAKARDTTSSREP